MSSVRSGFHPRFVKQPPELENFEEKPIWYGPSFLDASKMIILTPFD